MPEQSLWEKVGLPCSDYELAFIVKDSMDLTVIDNIVELLKVDREEIIDLLSLGPLIIHDSEGHGTLNKVQGEKVYSFLKVMSYYSSLKGKESIFEAYNFFKVTPNPNINTKLLVKLLDTQAGTDFVMSRMRIMKNTGEL